MAKFEGLDRAAVYQSFQDTYGPLGWSLLFWTEACFNSGIDFESLSQDLIAYLDSRCTHDEPSS